MNDVDKRKFMDLMMSAGEVYSKEVTIPMVTIYFQALASLSIEQASGALMAHMQDPNCGQYFPKPADLMRQIVGTSKQQDAAIEDRAAIAWSCIELQIRRVGVYGSLQLDDRQALATVKAMGGWKDICGTEQAKMEWKRKEFIRMYETFERTPVDALPSNLPGLIELSEHKAKAQEGMKSISDGVAKFRANQPKMIGEK